jgi:hypothetical protein
MQCMLACRNERCARLGHAVMHNSKAWKINPEARVTTGNIGLSQEAAPDQAG